MKRPREERHPCGLFVSGNEMFFRPMNPADLDAVMNIERASFSYPWSPGFFLQELRIPCARSLIALMEGKIVAYVIYWLLPDEMDIHNLAVHSAYRRQGIGRSLLQEVIDEARRNGSSRVTLEVRRSNEAAQRLYYSLGFVERGVRKGYYSADGEDALAMVLEFDS